MENKIIKKILENGVEVYLYKDETKHSVHVNLVTNFGGMDSQFVLNQNNYKIPNGIAHFLEHLLIEHSYYGNLFHFFSEEGLSLNGLTSPSYTRFYFSGVKNIEKGIEILIKGLSTPSFTKENLEKTKPSIIEEIRGCNDNKFRRLLELKNNNLFKKSLLRV